MKISTTSEILAAFRSKYPGLPEKVYQGVTEAVCRARNELTLAKAEKILSEKQEASESNG